jgi:hypothetical protein
MDGIGKYDMNNQKGWANGRLGTEAAKRRATSVHHGRVASISSAVLSVCRGRHRRGVRAPAPASDSSTSRTF